jgi:hypothetical protein
MQKWISKSIVKTVKQKKWTIHGGHAIMTQLPKHLRRETEDYDIWSRGPKRSSTYLHGVLERREPGEQFSQSRMKIGGHKNTYVYRVIDKETGKVVADFMTTPSGKNLYVVIKGVRYETLKHAKSKYAQILSNPELRQRHAKARGDLQRIEQFEFETSRTGIVKQSTLSNLPDRFSFSKHIQVSRGW